MCRRETATTNYV